MSGVPISSPRIAGPSFGTSAFVAPLRRIAALGLILALGACASGQAGGPMTADSARRILGEQGYEGLRDLRPTAGGFAAEATRDGQPVTVIIDGNGIIHTQ